MINFFLPIIILKSLFFLDYFLVKKEFAFANTQTEPVVEHKNTWTGEPDYKKYVIIFLLLIKKKSNKSFFFLYFNFFYLKRYFIVRVYKPAEFGPKRVKFTIKYDDQVFVSKIFEATKVIIF